MSPVWFTTSLPPVLHFFIEPAAIVSLNNQLKELALQEKEEIEVILATLSASCSEHIAALGHNLKLLTQLDFIFAKAGLAIDMNASRPLLITNTTFRSAKDATLFLIRRKSFLLISHLEKTLTF